MNIIFNIDMRYWCEICGSMDGKCTEDGMCFHCGADDWEPYNTQIAQCYNCVPLDYRPTPLEIEVAQLKFSKKTPCTEDSGE